MMPKAVARRCCGASREIVARMTESCAPVPRPQQAMPITARGKLPRNTSGAAATDAMVARTIVQIPIVEQRTQRQRAQAVDRHRDRVKDRGPSPGHDLRFVEMVGDQRKIRVAGGDESDGDDVDPEDRCEALAFERRQGELEIMGPGKEIAGSQK